MGDRASGGASASAALDKTRMDPAKMAAVKSGASRSGMSALLHDKGKMGALAEQLGSIGDEMTPQQPAPAPMSPMALGGGDMANGDPSALAAMMQARQRGMAPPVSIFDRLQRMRGY